MNIVYKITNTETGRVYIGSSTRGVKRFKQHEQLFKVKTHPIKEMQSDYELYGSNVFEYKVLQSFIDISDHELRRIEEGEIKIHSEICKLYNTEVTCGSHYPNIKELGLKHKDISRIMGYSSVESFRTSSAHRRHMQGIENILELLKEPKHRDGLIKHFQNQIK